MKFELNEYHQGVTNDELIKDLIKASEKLENTYLSQTIYKEHGRYSPTTVCKRFGSWEVALSHANLRTERNQKEMQRISDSDLFNEVKSIAAKLGRNTITSVEYEKYGRYAFPTINKLYPIDRAARVFETLNFGQAVFWNP